MDGYAGYPIELADLRNGWLLKLLNALEGLRNIKEVMYGRGKLYGLVEKLRYTSFELAVMLRA